MDQKEKSRERMINLNKSKGMSIDILDTKTNCLLSIRQAAEAVGCVHRTILLEVKMMEYRNWLKKDI